MDDVAKRQELTTELKSARNWILAVGIILVTVTAIMVEVEISKYAGAPSDLVAQVRFRVYLICAIVLAFFIGCYILAKYKPVLGCVLALVGYWGLQIYEISQGAPLYSGIIMKVLFTMALVKGIKSASRAQHLQSELGKVFE